MNSTTILFIITFLWLVKLSKDSSRVKFLQDMQIKFNNKVVRVLDKITKEEKDEKEL